ncbi:ApeP family dehydratase [Pseudoalteromonas sp. T1lg48]|uniref:ApeP family dehydratase n=1 Tax=Pseudoalteromonas sp. T1lg48 TaxID=2077100 RepID=UPI000CF69BC6|nr:3-hydroxylacyl-ACP dehydratase [Pseudoalteromonas sp. T1lg48]
MPDIAMTELIAHRPPMVLIDSLVSFDDNSAHCQVRIRENSPFYDAEQGAVPSYIGSEYMAQAIAAYAGAHDLDQSRDIKIGFLLGSRKIRCHKPRFDHGMLLDILVEKVIQDESGLSVFACRIEHQGDCLVEAKINVFQPADPMKFIKENQ